MNPAQNIVSAALNFENGDKNREKVVRSSADGAAHRCFTPPFSESVTLSDNRLLDDALFSFLFFCEHLGDQSVASDRAADGSCLLSKSVTEPAAMLLVTARLIGFNPFGSHRLG